MTLVRILWVFSFVLAAGCASHRGVSPGASHGGSSDFGVLVMAHAATMQETLQRLEARGARRVGIVRLFISGESWYERAETVQEP